MKIVLMSVRAQDMLRHHLNEDGTEASTAKRSPTLI
jgi:hypothetical protein